MAKEMRGHYGWKANTKGSEFRLRPRSDPTPLAQAAGRPLQVQRDAQAKYLHPQ